jgi:hypothetical protein
MDNLKTVARAEIPGRSFDRVRFLCHLAVDPVVYVAFSPSQMLSYPIGGESPFPPFVAHGALWNSQYRGNIA